jgi:hypothetical protein
MSINVANITALFVCKRPTSGLQLVTSKVFLKKDVV